MEITNPMPKGQIDSATDQLRADLGTLASDIEALKSDVAALGWNQVDRVKANVADMDQNLSARLSEKPLRTLGIAFAAGYLFAAITR
jgi:outer membrane murein-binding lipoprotein Lpp